jgi:hypothetical protein
MGRDPDLVHKAIMIESRNKRSDLGFNSIL